MTIPQEIARGLFICGLTIAIGFLIYCLFAFWQNCGVKSERRSIDHTNSELACDVKSMRAITLHHKDLGWLYYWNGPIKPPGKLVLAYREWAGPFGETEHCLELYLVKKSGEVRLLGTDLQLDVFGEK